jgi:ferrous iron transport protein A
MFLSEAPNGASFRVVKLALGKEVGRRLADMGFTEGAEGAVVRKGFFYGPLQIRILGYDILIRRYEASGIEVEPVGDWSAVHDAVKWFGGRRMRRRQLGLSEDGSPASGGGGSPPEKGAQ